MRVHGTPTDTRRLVAVISSGFVGLVIVGLAAMIRIPLLLGTIGAANVGLVITVASGTQIALVGVAGARSAARVIASETGQPEANSSREITLLGNWRWSAAVPVLAFASVAALTLPALTTAQPRAEFVVALVASCLCSIVAFPGGRAWGELEAHGALASVNVLNPLTSLIALGATWALLRAPHPVLVHSTIGTLSAVGPFFIAQLWARRLDHSRPSTQTRASTPLVGLEAFRSLPWLAIRSTDPIILTALGFATVVGDFTIIQRIGMMMTGMAVFARPVWSRRAAALRAEHAHPQAELRLGSYYRSTVVQATFLGAVGAAGVAVAAWVATMFVEFTIDDFWILVGLTAVTVLLTALATVFGTFLAGRLAARAGSRIEAGSAIVKVVVTVVLVNSFGAVGAIAGTIIALVSLTALEYRLLRLRPQLLADMAAGAHRDDAGNAPVA